VERAPQLDTVFYDGTCGLCHRFVTFLLARDGDGTRFRYAPIGGRTFQEAIPAERRTSLPDSIVVRTADGRILVRSEAVAEALGRLPGSWPRLGGAVAACPRGVADLAYDAVARVRRGLFSRPAGACPIVPPELRSRFLD